MKFKIAVEMELDIPDVHVEKINENYSEFCEDFAKSVVDETASSMASVHIGVKYIDFSWIGENDIHYADGVFCNLCRQVLDWSEE